MNKSLSVALSSLRDPISASGVTVQLSLFRWYRDHLLALLPQEVAEGTNTMWCTKNAPQEIRDWYAMQGINRWQMMIGHAWTGHAMEMNLPG